MNLSILSIEELEELIQAANSLIESLMEREEIAEELEALRSMLESKELDLMDADSDIGERLLEREIESIEYDISIAEGELEAL